MRRRRSSSLPAPTSSFDRARARLRATSGGVASVARTFAASARVRISCPSEPRRRSATLPSSASRRPTTAITGDLGQAVLADLVVDLLVAQVGLDPQAAPPAASAAAFSAIVVGVGGDRRHHHLHRRQPQRERAGVVLDQHADEPLHRAADRPVQHHRPLLGAVLGHIFGVEALGQHDSPAAACRTATSGRWRRSGGTPAWGRRRRPRRAASRPRMFTAVAGGALQLLPRPRPRPRRCRTARPAAGPASRCRSSRPKSR